MSSIKQIAKAIGSIVVLTLAAVLLVGLFVQVFNWKDKTITIVMQICKCIILLVACFCSIEAEKGLQKGCLAGMAGTAISYLICLLLSSGGSIDWFFPIELLIGASLGGIGGILAVNFKKK